MSGDAVTLTTDNSWATAEQAEDYCFSRLGGEPWINETDEDQKARALIDATRDLKVLTFDDEINNEDPPQWLIDATCELAFQYLVAGSPTLAIAENTGGVIRKKVDVLETEWSPGTRVEGLERYARVWALVSDHLAGGGNVEVQRV